MKYVKPTVEVYDSKTLEMIKIQATSCTAGSCGKGVCGTTLK